MIKNKKGFTLVEVTVVFLILAIVIAVASSIMIAGTNFLARSANISNAKFVGDSIIDNISSQISDATSLTVAPGGTAISEGDSAIRFADGHMQVNIRANGYTDLYGDEFYGIYLARLEAEAGRDGRFLDLKVSVYDTRTGEEQYTCEETVKLVNMISNQESVSVIPNDGENVALIYNNFDIDGALTELDRKTAFLVYITDTLTKQYDDLMAEYRRAETAQSRIDAENAIDRIYPVSTGMYPIAADYYALAKRICGERWPEFDRTQLSGMGNAALRSRLNTPALKVRPSYQVKDGEIVGVIYYAYLETGAEDRAYLVYNDRNNDWYYFDSPGYGGFSMAEYNSSDNSSYTKDNLIVNYLETGDAVGGGTFERINNN